MTVPVKCLQIKPVIRTGWSGICKFSFLYFSLCYDVFRITDVILLPEFAFFLFSSKKSNKLGFYRYSVSVAGFYAPV
jgi:hypothetical protein